MIPEELAAALERGDGPAIVCAQAGEVNTGCFDPFVQLAEICERHGAWLHVDGAVGLWAAASPKLRSLTEGLDRADSWSTDAHKWLNVPYDSGFIAVKDPAALRGAMGISAPYLKAAEGARDSYGVRTRVIAAGARLRPLRGAVFRFGRAGVADLVERTSRLARSMARSSSGTPRSSC